jgi:hypothetical protein
VKSWSEVKALIRIRCTDPVLVDAPMKRQVWRHDDGDDDRGEVGSKGRVMA